MQSFSFRSNFDENQNVESLIKERNRKIARQQVIFAILLFIVLGLLVWYCVKKTIYVEFDGYVHTQYKDIRALEDIYLFDQYTDEGDIVVPGDTLYSYTFVNLFGLGNMGSEPDMLISDRNLRMQRDAAYAEANVLRVRIRELEAQIEREDNNIRFGLSDNSHKMDLQRQLAETKAQLQAVLNKAYIYGNAHSESQNSIGNTAQYSIDFSNEQWGLDHTLRQLYEQNAPIVRYGIAQDTAIVTKIWAPPFSRVFKKEHIIQLEDLSYEKSNMQVIAWVPTQDMSKINNNTRAEIIVNDDLSFMATVQLLGARTEDLPEELRNNLSHTYTTVMVVFRPDRNQELPLWAVVDRVPVRVRIKNFDNGKRDDGSDYWYIDNFGLTEKSKYFLGLIRQKFDGRHRYISPVIPESVTKIDTSRRPGHYVEETPKESIKVNPDKEKAPAQADKQPASGTTKANAAPKKASQSAAAGSSSASSAQTRPRYKVHTIKEGETLYRLSVNHNVNIERIKELNPGIEKHFVVGSKVKIPN